MSGRILAGSLLPEPKTSLKCSITSLVSGNKLRFSKKKFTFSNSLSREPLEAHHSPPLTMLPRHMHMGSASAKHAPQAPRVGAHDVILTGLDEESDSTNEEMPPLEPLEPLEGAAQLGEVWLCGHEKTDVIPSPRLSWRCSSGRRSWGMRSSAGRRRAERSPAGRASTWGWSTECRCPPMPAR